VLDNKELCFIDIETTGILFGYHELIEVAAIRTSPDAGNVKQIWQKKIRPRYPDRITPYARELNGFTLEEWVDAPYSSVLIWDEFYNFAEGCFAVCHNPSFDRAFLSITAAEHGVVDLGLDYHWIGTESLGWPLFLRGIIAKPSLGELCKFFGIPEEPIPHRAIEGAKRCREVYKLLVACLVVNSP